MGHGIHRDVGRARCGPGRRPWPLSSSGSSRSGWWRGPRRRTGGSGSERPPGSRASCSPAPPSWRPSTSSSTAGRCWWRCWPPAPSTCGWCSTARRWRRIWPGTGCAGGCWRRICSSTRSTPSAVNRWSDPDDPVSAPEARIPFMIGAGLFLWTSWQIDDAHRRRPRLGRARQPAPRLRRPARLPRAARPVPQHPAGGGRRPGRRAGCGRGGRVGRRSRLRHRRRLRRDRRRRAGRARHGAGPAPEAGGPG